MSYRPVDKGDWLTLNVGGKHFLTTRTTLCCCQEPNSMLARMFCNKNGETKDGPNLWENSQDSSGAYLIDRSPRYFEPILNYLRHGQLVFDNNISIHGILEEAKFYGLFKLVQVIEAKIKSENPPDDHSPLTRRDVVKILTKTPYCEEYQLRFQGVNMEGADLSYLDLRNTNFKHANLQRVNFSGANLSYCNMERANLANAIFDGAQLVAVKMICANLDDASLKGCNFEDPHQTSAVLEGASLKNANFDGSQMARVNLRVTSLKNAILRNCDLKCAVLAGADLENCDLSGSDLQQANLRGANFKGATFELMVTPLHMSQAVN